MNAIKNFFHSTGDIIFGLIVVGVAVFLIGSQISDDINVLKIYDSVKANVTGKPIAESTEKPIEILADPNNTGSNISDPKNESTTTNPDGSTPVNMPNVRNIEISEGSTADEVASGLFVNGVISSKEEFLVEYAKLPVGRSIIGGNYQIPSGSTPAQILNVIAPE